MKERVSTNCVAREQLHVPVGYVDTLWVLMDKTVTYSNKTLCLIKGNAISRARDCLLISKFEFQ